MQVLLASKTKLPVVTLAFDYARLSKDRTRLSENVGIQHAESRAYIDDQEWEYGGSFDDNDISISKYSTKPRLDYDRMITAIKAVRDRDDARVRVVIVITEMPRLYRQMEELLPLIKMAESTRLSGIWTTEGIGYDLSTAEGIHAAIGAVNNAMLESARLSKRQKRKKAARAEQGRYLGGSRAYGFEGPIKDAEGNITNRGRINIAEVEHEIAVWLDCNRRLVAGEGQMPIVVDLNKRGIPSPMGKQWTVANFKRLMTKKRYVIYDGPKDNPDQRGILEHNGVEHMALWRGLITRQQHTLLLARLEETGQHWGHGLIKGRSYLLSGLIFCGSCGARAYGNGRKLPDGAYQRRYRCKKHDNHGGIVGCGKVFRGADPLDTLVTEAVLYRFDTPDVARALAPREDEDEKRQVEQLIERVQHGQLHRAELVKEYGRGEHSKADYKVMLAAADEAIAGAQADLAKMQRTDAAKLLPAGQAVREVWDSASLDWRRNVIKLLVERVVIHPGHPGSKLWNGWRFDPASVEIVWRR